MAPGLLLGLFAALGWGLVDVSAAIAGRRLGPLLLSAGAQSLGLLVFGALALLTGVAVTTTAWVPAAVFGTVAGVAYVSAFAALRIGPLAVVSPVMAAWGGLTVVLSVLFRSESLGPVDWLGVGLATTGIVLVGLVVDGETKRARVVSVGVVFALLANVGFAVSTVGLAEPIQQAGWLSATVVSRSANVALVLLIVTAALVLRPAALAPAVTVDTRRGARPLVAGILAVGLFDAAATISFSVGLETSLTWLVGLTSSFGPALAVVFAVGVLGERLRPVQWFGLGLLATAVVALALPV